MTESIKTAGSQPSVYFKMGFSCCITKRKGRVRPCENFSLVHDDMSTGVFNVQSCAGKHILRFHGCNIPVTFRRHYLSAGVLVL